MTAVAKEDEAKFQWTNVRNQYYGTIAVNLIMLSCGFILGWIAPALSVLASANTPLVTGPLTTAQLSWIGSIHCISGLLGSFLFGYVTTLIGCKRATIMLSLPAIGFWLLIYFGTTYTAVLIARFFAGIVAGGIQVTVILYVSEIANDDMRGRLGSYAMFMRNIGILCGYILGAVLDYKYIPCVCIFVPIIFGIVFTLFPNTAQFQIKKGHVKKAEHALKFYKGYKGENKAEDDAIYRELERLKSIASRKKEEAKFQVSDLCNRAAIWGLGVGLAMSSFSQISCCFTIITYAVILFERAGTALDPYISSIILAVTVLLGSLSTTFLADRLGRKTLNFISMSGAATGLFSASLYHYLRLNGFDLASFSWIPVVCLSLVTFVVSAGIVPLTTVCSIEYMPPKIRTFGMSFSAFALNLTCFVSTKVFPVLLEKLDLHGTLIIYGIGSVLAAIFILVVMKDTTACGLEDVGSHDKIKDRNRIASIISL